MGQDMPFAPAVVRKDFTRYDAAMNGVGIVAYIEYFCRDRTFKNMAILVSLLNIFGQLAAGRKEQHHLAEISFHPAVQCGTLLLSSGYSNVSRYWGAR